MDPGFTLQVTNLLALEGLPIRTNAESFLGGNSEVEKGARVLSLEAALAMGVQRGRMYQTRREQLYIAALDLGLARHLWTPIFTASAHGAYDVRTSEIQLVPDQANPGSFKTVTSDNLVETHQVSAGGPVGVGWLIRDVGRLTTAFTTDFLRILSSGPGAATHSSVNATLTRPLLRNAGFQQQMENLTQAERGLLYEIRDFTRFRKDYSVQISTAYYAVLGNRDVARNSHQNLQSSQKNSERTRALAAEGRIAQAELGRLEQQQLTVEAAWINALRNYRQSLDDLKLQLGLPVDANVVLDDRELEKLQIRHPQVTPEEATQVAMAARLDYLTARDQVDDTGRRSKVARSFLKPQLDLVASTRLSSGPDTARGFPLPDPNRYSWQAGVDVDLPFDRTAERNAYRSALIAEDRARRDLALREDQIRQQVRDGWRNLEQARRAYEIAELGVTIALRRVEEQGLLAELGRAKAQDQVDAQNALNDSRNQRTQALVNHTIARLQFWNNMGILYIKENGQWEEGGKPAPRTP